MTALVRQALREAFQAARDPHPGLLLQRGWTDYVRADAATGGKARHIGRLCAMTASDFYGRAYQRWSRLTADEARFSRIALKIEARLLIGLASGSALETGCAISHSHGMPYLPGSSVKGVVRAWAEKNLPEWRTRFDDLFGIADLSGLVVFHDAWWIPESGGAGHQNQPYVADIVTPHHPDYYAGNGPASDLDSPVPNPLIGVRGSFLFVIEGERGWRQLAEKMLTRALEDKGIGAKTRAGYGRLVADPRAAQKMEQEHARQAAAQNFVRARLSRNIAANEIKAALPDGRTTAPLRGAEATALLDKLPEDLRNGRKIKDGKLAVDVAVSVEGNMIRLLDLRPIQE